MTVRSVSGLSAPSLTEIEQLAREVFQRLPAKFRNLCGDVLFSVEDFPAEDVLDHLKAETPFDILGLFQGVGLAQDAAVPERGECPTG